MVGHARQFCLHKGMMTLKSAMIGVVGAAATLLLAKDAVMLHYLATKQGYQ